MSNERINKIMLLKHDVIKYFITGNQPELDKVSYISRDTREIIKETIKIINKIQIHKYIKSSTSLSETPITLIAS